MPQTPARRKEYSKQYMKEYDAKKIRCPTCRQYRPPGHMTETGCKICDDPAWWAKQDESSRQVKRRVNPVHSEFDSLRDRFIFGKLKAA
jgi:hypothetical protein